MEEARQRGESEVAKKVKSLFQKEEPLLARAVAQTMQNYNEKPSVQNLRDWEAAKRAFEEFKTKEAAQADPAARRFKNLVEVHKYLEAEGWKASERKVYCDKNKIVKEKDGTYTIKSVDEYARRCLDKLDGSAEAAPGLADRKARLEVEILEEKKKEAIRENEIEAGKLILRSEVEQKHTAKLALFLIAVDNFIRGGKLDEAVEMVGGSRDKMAEFRAVIKKEFRAMLGEYAKKPEFAVPKQAAAEAEEMIREVE